MNVSVLRSLSGTTPVPSSAAPAGSSTGGLGSADPADADDGNTTTQISKQGQFLSQLQNLGQTNPTEAKQVLTEMSTQLGQRAQQVSGDQAQALTAMAAKLQIAAITGDLTVLSAKGSGQDRQGAPANYRQGGGTRSSSKVASAYAHGANASEMSLLDMLSIDAAPALAGDASSPNGRAGTSTTA